MATEIIIGCTTDEEKAMAIFNWVRLHGNHQYSGDIRSLDPVLFFNVYGYGICAYFAAAQTGLARAAVLDARIWEIQGHTVGEIFYDARWHMLDPDMQLFFLNPDNRTVASIAELEKNLDFNTRTEAFQRTFEDAHDRVRNEHRSKHDTFRYDIRHPRYVQYDYDPYLYAGWRMTYALRPGERIVQRWQGSGKHNDYRQTDRFRLNEEEPHKTWPPVQYGNGTVSFRMDPDQAVHVSAYESRNVCCSPDGLIVDTSQNSDEGSRSFFLYRRPLPYLIVGGSVSGEGFREGDTAFDHFSVGGYRNTQTDKQSFYQQQAAGRRAFTVSLDDFLYPEKGRYALEHGIRVNMGRYAGNFPSTRTGLAALDVVTEFQTHPRSLPALLSGENRVQVLHTSAWPFEARVTHTWTERHGIPNAPAPFLRSPEGVTDLIPEGIAFSWSKTAGAVSYRFQLSLHHLCLFPLSPNFDVDLKDDRTSFHAARGWFNPNTTYYWRVQAKSAYGLWGRWSRIQPFNTR
ncbi:MAG: transglutaminase domain-containing protein [candidate division Zixibacteria bacterium]|nr:transglutaminase domain-containing protein [candidate division Zixibacteria bacterium]